MKNTVRTITEGETKRKIKTLREFVGFLGFEIFIWAFKLTEYETVEVTYSENRDD